MGKFLEFEKKRQAELKHTSSLFSNAARADGLFGSHGNAYSHCLPRENSSENLLPEIRNSGIAYFSASEICWHNGVDGNPSNNLCDSQVCCVNFLEPFADKPDALTKLISPIFPMIKKILPMEEPNRFVSYEWIGFENYLKEKVQSGENRIRGALCTSADAAVMFEREDGLIQIVLIEWKYTESYSSTSLKVSKAGTDRTEIYAHLFDRDDFPLDKDVLPSFASLFFDPFCQFFRQQCLAHEMEKARELGADIVSLMHIAPRHNTDFARVTSPDLQHLGDSVTDVWKGIVRQGDRFNSVYTEDLFGGFPISKHPELADWWEHIIHRYEWLQSTGI